MSFAIGDRVTLAGGGDAMTVTDVYDRGEGEFTIDTVWQSEKGKLERLEAVDSRALILLDNQSYLAWLMAQLDEDEHP